MITQKKRKSIKGKNSKSKQQKYVVVTNKSYGKNLKGTRIYFEGKRPSALQEDGRITFGKHILETLKKTFPKVRWIITAETDSVTSEYGIIRFRTSQKLLARMNAENWDRSRDIKNDIVQRFFSGTFPSHFKTLSTSTYVPGTIARIVDPKIVPRLSGEDKEALNTFLPKYVATEAIGMVHKLQATAQIDTLKSLAKNLEAEIERGHPESWWQSYIKSNILLMQQGYIKPLDKLNVALGETKFPDFCLITHDNYIDILEIKKPDTPLLVHDNSRDNYYWHKEMAMAISQTENYIEQVSSKAADFRSYLLDKESINIKAVRPRGIILAGDVRSFETQKQKDDFRLLSQGIKNVIILTYDELLTRLKNYIGVLDKFSDVKGLNKPKKSHNKRDSTSPAGAKATV